MASVQKKNNKKHTKKSAILNWNSGGNLSNTTRNKDYLRNGSISNNIENSTKIIIPRDGVLSNFVVSLLPSNNAGNAKPGDGITRNFIIRKNGLDTDLFVGITGNNTNGEINIKLPVKKFDFISLSHTVNHDTTNSAIGIASVLFS